MIQNNHFLNKEVFRQEFKNNQKFQDLLNLEIEIPL